MKSPVIKDREELVAALCEWGVDYLTSTEPEAKVNINEETLIVSLVAHLDSRLRQALIALFLLHPQLAVVVPRLLENLDSKLASELTAYYMAAMYLQRMWRFRLEHYLSSVIELPDFFSEELDLPNPQEEHGKVGLYALAEWQASLSPYRLNHLSEYEGVAELLFQSLKMKRNNP